jgi:nucleoside-diphosphate-sugar epimerase
MEVIITGSNGRVGTALLDNQSNKYEYIPFDKNSRPDRKTIIGDIADYETVKTAFEGSDGVVHLAADPNVAASFESILESNIVGAYNCLEACREYELTDAVLASSNHVVGMYEQEFAPELYEKDHNLLLDHTTVPRPDSLYGVSKVFLEALGRFYAETYEYPKRVYALRIGSVRTSEYNHPYGDAEKGVDEGKWEPDSPSYRREVRRMKATWQSRRDVASLIECCLQNESVTFDIFYGVSNNDATWFDISHAEEQVGYKPQDIADDWGSPPDDNSV